VGKTLGESALRSRYGVTIVGVKRPREAFIYAQPDTMVMADSILIVSGSTSEVEAFAGTT
jgi:trk system potassium uptake protein TrkA